MTCLLSRIFAALTLLCLIAPVHAQEDDPYAGLDREQLAAVAKEQEAALTELGQQLDVLKAQAQAQQDEALKEAIRNVRLTYYQAQEQQNRTIAALLEKQEDIFLYQDIASYTLLVIVVVVTMAGVLFSAKELNRSIAAAEAAEKRIAHARMEGTPGGPQEGAAPGVPNNIKIGFDGIQITSALTGVTVLTLSLAFLYLFLQDVYRLEAVRVPHIEDRAQEASAKK